jgi:hypothetical protein
MRLQAAAGETLSALALCGALLACNGTPRTPVTSGEPSGQPPGPRWVSGYYAGWFWDWYPPAVVDMTAMTHLIFGRYAPGGGTLGGRPGQGVEGAGPGHDDSVEQALVEKRTSGHPRNSAR